MCNIDSNLINKMLYSKYIVVKGVEIYGNAVLSLCRVDKEAWKADKYKIMVKAVDGRYVEFFKSNIFKKIRTKKALFKWGRLLAYQKTKPLFWKVIDLKEIR